MSRAPQAVAGLVPVGWLVQARDQLSPLAWFAPGEPYDAKKVLDSIRE